MFTQRPLGEAGLTYIRERLDGGLTPAQHLLQVLPTEQGQAVTYLPAWVPDTYATDFEGAWGILTDPAVHQQDPILDLYLFLRDVIRTFL
ncbi:MAG TPA: hypothetical protein VF807_15455, partial [Ktedonobacterales bacterium]